MTCCNNRYVLDPTTWQHPRCGERAHVRCPAREQDAVLLVEYRAYYSQPHVRLVPRVVVVPTRPTMQCTYGTHAACMQHKRNKHTIQMPRRMHVCSATYIHHTLQHTLQHACNMHAIYRPSPTVGHSTESTAGLSTARPSSNGTPWTPGRSAPTTTVTSAPWRCSSSRIVRDSASDVTCSTRGRRRELNGRTHQHLVNRLAWVGCGRSMLSKSEVPKTDALADPPALASRSTRGGSARAMLGHRTG